MILGTLLQNRLVFDPHTQVVYNLLYLRRILHPRLIVVVHRAPAHIKRVFKKGVQLITYLRGIGCRRRFEKLFDPKAPVGTRGGEGYRLVGEQRAHAIDGKRLSHFQLRVPIRMPLAVGPVIRVLDEPTEFNVFVREALV